MKKFFVLVIIVILLVGSLIILNKNDNELHDSNIQTENNEQINDINIEQENLSVITLNGIEFKNINSIKMDEIKFDNNMIYADVMNENNEIYVKLSEEFILNDDKKTAQKFEILPSKIYTTDIKSKYIFSYNGEAYYIPAEICEEGKDRIIYRNYNLELLKENDSIKMNTSTLNDVTPGWDLRDSSEYNGELRYEDVSLCEAFLETWKINDDIISQLLKKWNEFYTFEDYVADRSRYTHIYRVDFDNNEDTIQLIYTSGIAELEDSHEPKYNLIDYANNEIKKSETEMIYFENVLNYKNVFYGQGHIWTINEDLYTDYYIYDNDNGLMHINNRFINGEKFNEDGFEKLSKVPCTLRLKYYVQSIENGIRQMHAFPNYPPALRNEKGVVLETETGMSIADPNAEFLEEGTKIYIEYISDDGLEFNFRTEDGTKYSMYCSYT